MQDRRSIVILLIIILFSFTVKAQPNKALAYMEKINHEIRAIMTDTWDYTSEVAHGKNARRVEVKRKELVRTSKQAMEKVSKMDGFEGNTEYRDSVVSYLRINYLVLNEDYEKILDLEEIAEQSYDNMEAYLLTQQLANEKLDAADDTRQEQEKKFAAEHHINLVESNDKLSRKLEKAGDVFKSYNAAYLVFFKVYKQDAYFWEAVNKKDINAMEQNKNALASLANDALVKVKVLLPYKMDKSLIFACKS